MLWLAKAQELAEPKPQLPGLSGGGGGWAGGWEEESGKRGFLSHLISAPNSVLFNSKPNPPPKDLMGQSLLKITFNTTPSSSAPAGKVKQMAFIDKFIYMEGAT